ncbi:MAG: polysaccharide pyruvyl transferase family protein [Altibacter sp.]|uniref:polysaccharide pyruvyl transferase family protein n=1 Tax=Altibacter sp. TaxID=2024823 RepID=UPI001D654E9C|nr:polysaccharide pyruvyl transferase family protein [Altibacter sp.]MBZ0326147.1 polysaccharide pyruvyl transferase family protein [Altibacter sp.]
MNRKRKIGLFTMPLGTNYGGILQLVALQYFLNQQGYETILINRRYPSSMVKRMAKKIVETNGIFDLKEIAFKKKISIELDRFKAKYIPSSTRPLYTEAALIKDTKKQQFDTVIVGSDQVWRIGYMQGIWQHAFLNFISKPETKKIAYAASFGNETWDYPKLSPKISELLLKFDAVSVREDSGIAICKEHFGCADVQHTIDPTLLVDDGFYRQFLKERADLHPTGIFAFFLDQDSQKRDIFEQLEKALRIKGTIFPIGKKISEYKRLRGYKKPRVEEWLYGFATADFVITDSYHGMLLSLVFERPFLAIANKKRGLARFTSVLKKLGLENRLMHEKGQLPLEILSKPINYEEVRTKLEIWRKESELFLINALEK